MPRRAASARGAHANTPRRTTILRRLKNCSIFTRDKIAAIIVEPIAANMGVVAPEPGFLKSLREITRRQGALLIFDEVITGFRVCYGGAQNLFGIAPDLTTLGKIIGGGLPCGRLWRPG